MTKEDFRYMFSKDMVSYNGYLLQTERKGVTTQPRKTPLADYSFGENAWTIWIKSRSFARKKYPSGADESTDNLSGVV